MGRALGRPPEHAEERRARSLHGYLVLQSDDDKSFEVIDGQQRLTTLTLLTLAALKHLQRLIDAGENVDENKARLEELRRTYVGSLDPVSLTTHSKLTLNRNNNDYFQQYLVPLQRLPQRRLRFSEHSLRKSFEWFEKHLETWLDGQQGDRGRAIAQFVSEMSDKLFFTVINVTDELNAYRVFETLNARGVKLSSTDLLKNSLFSVLHRQSTTRDEDMPVLESRWESLLARLGSEGFPEFLRAYWLSTGRFVRHADLFKAVRREVTDRSQVFELLRQLDEDLDTYVALQEPEVSTLPPRAKHHAQTLRLFGVKQPFPLLLAARRKLTSDGFEKVLRACVVISFRYNVVGGLSPGEQEPVFATAARGLADGTLTTDGELIGALARVYPSDEKFKASFVEKVFTKGKTRLARYVLAELERQSGGASVDPDNDAISLEHVLPLSPGQNWDAFRDQDIEAMSGYLGNMALLRRGTNNALGNADWATKRPVLEASEYKLTHELAKENAEWTPARLMARQNKLAHLAGAVWRIDQLS